MKYFILLIVLFLMPSLAFAQSADFQWGDRSFVVWMVRASNGFQLDKNARPQYKILGGDISQEFRNVDGSYKARIISVHGQVLREVSFGLPSKTSFQVVVPYFDNASKIDFVDSVGKIQTTLSLQATLICNENNVCENDKGELPSNCPSDCHTSQYYSPAPISSPIPSNSILITPRFSAGPTPIAGEQSSISDNVVSSNKTLIGLIAILISLIGLAIVFFLSYRSSRR